LAASNANLLLELLALMDSTHKMELAIDTVITIWYIKMVFAIILAYQIMSIMA
jgi:hypothetical protein